MDLSVTVKVTIFSNQFFFFFFNHLIAVMGRFFFPCFVTTYFIERPSQNYFAELTDLQEFQTNVSYLCLSSCLCRIMLPYRTCVDVLLYHIYPFILNHRHNSLLSADIGFSFYSPLKPFKKKIKIVSHLPFSIPLVQIPS